MAPDCVDCTHQGPCALLHEINKVRDEEEFAGTLYELLPLYCKWAKEK